MRVLNYNKDIRSDIILKYKEKGPKEIFDILNNEDEYSRYIAGIFYQNMYIMYLAELNYYKNDEAKREEFEKFKKFDSIESYVASINEEDIPNIIEDLIYFSKLDLYSRKALLRLLNKDKDYIKKIFPNYLLDLVEINSNFYCDFITEDYYNRKNHSSSNAFSDTVKASTEKLIKLEKEDFESYKIALLNIIEKYYKYIKYSLGVNGVENNIDIDVMEMIEDDLLGTVYFSIKNIKLLRNIIKRYLEYSLLSDSEKRKVDLFFSLKENKKDLRKVLTKSKKLKNE